MISLIVAKSSNNIIGYNNKIPWKSKKDLAYFKKITENNIVIMGRKTFESLNNKPLINRKNVVITRNTELESEDVKVFSCIEEAINFNKKQEKDIFFIGGSKIYEECIKYCDKLYITEICNIIEGDTYFPDIDYNQWKIESEYYDFENDFKIIYRVYSRINKKM